MKPVNLRKLQLVQKSGQLALSCRLVRAYTKPCFFEGFLFPCSWHPEATLEKVWGTWETLLLLVCPSLCFSHTLKAGNCQNQKQNCWGVETCTLCSFPTAVKLPPRWTENVYSPGTLISSPTISRQWPFLPLPILLLLHTEAGRSFSYFHFNKWVSVPDATMTGGEGERLCGTGIQQKVLPSFLLHSFFFNRSIVLMHSWKYYYSNLHQVLPKRHPSFLCLSVKNKRIFYNEDSGLYIFS